MNKISWIGVFLGVILLLGAAAAVSTLDVQDPTDGKSIFIGTEIRVQISFVATPPPQLKEEAEQVFGLLSSATNKALENRDMEHLRNLHWAIAQERTKKLREENQKIPSVFPIPRPSTKN